MNELVSAYPNRLPVKTPARKSILGIQERREEQLKELLLQVVNKLMTDMVKGRVGFFHDKKTGQLLTEVFDVDLKSAKLPSLNVSVWRNFVATKNDPKPLRLYMYFFDYRPEDVDKTRVLHIVQKWDAAENDYEILYKKDEKLLSHREKINFLRDILASGVDEKKVAKHFGRPYHKGDTYTINEEGWGIYIHDGEKILSDPDLYRIAHEGNFAKREDIEDNTTYTSYWVCDLLQGDSLLNSGPLPEPKALT